MKPTEPGTAQKPTKTPPGQARGLRQAMSRQHTWAGLLAGWLLYAMFLTGTASYFREEISRWMRPELPSQASIPDPAEAAGRIADQLSALAPDSDRWTIVLPSDRAPYASAFWRDGARRAHGIFDPWSGRRLAARETAGGDFFYTFHFQFHYLPDRIGRWVAGLCAMFMLVAIVSGVITHKKIFTDFFTFRWGKGQRSWLDAHNLFAVFGLPFHVMITYSGLVILMLMYMPWGAQAAYKTVRDRQAMLTEMGTFLAPIRPVGGHAPMVPMAEMVHRAQARWGRHDVATIRVQSPGDPTARVLIVRGEHSRVSISPQYLVFDATSGKLLQAKDRVGPAAETRGVLAGLHLGRFADTVTRWLYFLVSLAGTAMVGTGLVLWTVKRRARLPDPARPDFGFRLVERLNIASIAGLSVAMTAFFWANRLLPVELAQRAQWEVHAFFVVWALTVLHAMVRAPRRAWTEQLAAAAAMLALLPLLNALTTHRDLFASLRNGDWIFVGFDLAWLGLAVLHAVLAVRTGRRRSPDGGDRWRAGAPAHSVR